MRIWNAIVLVATVEIKMHLRGFEQTCHSNSSIIIIIIIVLALPLLLLLPFLVSVPLAKAQTADNNSNPEVFPPESKPYGLTYGEWSAKWWQWALSIPADTSPLQDKTGENCDVNQSGPVWFLAGTTGGPAERTCVVPAGRAIFFPIVNGYGSFAENPLIKTESELRALGKSSFDQVKIVEATVDGVKLENLENYRVQSPLFNFTYPKNNIGGVPPGPSQAIADGYWVMLHPLSAGEEHTIHFRGGIVDPTATSNINFVTDVIYHLTISDDAEATTQTNEKTAAATTTNATTTTTTAGNDQEPIMLEGTSSSGNFNVKVNWTSNDIGAENTFDLKFFDAASGNEISNPTYSVMLFKGQEHLDDSHREDQTASQQTYTFDEPGNYILRIENINGSGTGDGIEIPIQVTPEFPSMMVMLALVAALFGTILITATRRKSFLA